MPAASRPGHPTCGDLPLRSAARSSPVTLHGARCAGSAPPGRHLLTIGPVAALDEDGDPLPVGGPRRRSVLAALLLHRGSILPVERLVTMLWSDPAPPTAPTMVHGAVAAIRRVLAPLGLARMLVTRDGGYSLDVPAERVDAARFEQALTVGRDALGTSPQRASAVLAAALAEWRGPALAGVDEPFARAAAARLDELRLRCHELWADAELRRGGHDVVVADLEELVAAHPLREELCAHLIVALYRCGRQVDALAAYRRLHATLVAELGVEPGLRLREVLAPLRASGRPLDDSIGLVPYLDWQRAPDPGYPRGRRHYWKSGYLRRLTDGALDALLELVPTIPSPETGIGMQGLRGAAARVPVDATAFPHRAEQDDLLILAQWADPARTDEHVGWARDAFDELAPHLEDAVYVNNLGVEGPERVRSAYGPNHARLAALKRTYDPDNVLRLNQNIPPA